MAVEELQKDNMLSWEEVVARKRVHRDAALEAAKPLVAKAISADELESITSRADLLSLQRAIKERVYSAEQVTLAYIQKAIATHDKTNSLTEICFQQAINQARQLDASLNANGTTSGPLHGIPVTLKDQFNIQGFDSTLGYVGRAGKPKTEDAALIKILRGLGAVVIAKTNLPQSIMWAETDNPLWGLTVNPRDPDFSPGGSTGGEGALLATNASILGWGTDIGGSVRIPAATNGLYGLRPSSGRLPYLGSDVSTEGQEHVHSVIGPMARSLSTITYATKLVIAAEPWHLDPRCHPLPWRLSAYDEMKSRLLVIGIVHDDNVVRPHPPIQRALRSLETKLRAAGHEVITWDTSDHQELIDIMDLYYTADGCEDIRRDVEAGGEPYIPHVELLVNQASAISVYEYWQLNRRKLAAQVAYNNKWETTFSPNGRKVDILLTPTMPHTAVPHRRTKWIGYTKVWNILDYTALSIPAGFSDEKVDMKPEYTPRNEFDKWNWETYDAQKMSGHPIGLQIIGRRLEEEKVLGAAEIVEGLLRS